MPEPSGRSLLEADAYAEGRRDGLALAAVAVAAVAFFNLLGAEKSLLALALAWGALRGGSPLEAAHRSARLAVGLAMLHFLVLGGLLIVFGHRLRQLVSLLLTLG